MKRNILIAKPDGSNELLVTEKAFENIYKEKGFVAIGDPVEAEDRSAPSNRRAEEFTSTDASGEVSAASIARELGISQGVGGAETDQGKAGTDKTGNRQQNAKNLIKAAGNAKTAKKVAPKKDRKVTDGKAAPKPTPTKPAEVKTATNPNESNLNNQTTDNGGAESSSNQGAGGSGGVLGKTD